LLELQALGFNVASLNWVRGCVPPSKNLNLAWATPTPDALQAFSTLEVFLTVRGQPPVAIVGSARLVSFFNEIARPYLINRFYFDKL
jgi:hypothetical protein